MAKRRKRRAKHHRKSARRKTAKGSSMKSIAANRRAHWAAYRVLQKRIDNQWAKLRGNVARKAKPQIITRDRNHLLLLLGECNYMARECMKVQKSRRR